MYIFFFPISVLSGGLCCFSLLFWNGSPWFISTLLILTISSLMQRLSFPHMYLFLGRVRNALPGQGGLHEVSSCHNKDNTQSPDLVLQIARTLWDARNQLLEHRYLVLQVLLRNEAFYLDTQGAVFFLPPQLMVTVCRQYPSYYASD